MKQKFYIVGQRIVSAFVEVDTSFSGSAHSKSSKPEVCLHPQRLQKEAKRGRLKSISIDRQNLFSNLIIKQYWKIEQFLIFNVISVIVIVNLIVRNTPYPNKKVPLTFSQ